MAKVIAPFLIRGTIDNINFVVTANGENYARVKGQTGVTSKQFKDNPIFDRIRNHAEEFGQCAKKAATFRQLTHHFNKLAKDGSYAGRSNKLLFEILQEDTLNPQGKRTVEAGLRTTDGQAALVHFESNKLRPLLKVLKIKEQYDPPAGTVTLIDFIAEQHLDWPEEATNVILATATTNWNFENDTFNTCYSAELLMGKESEKQTITLSTEIPAGNEMQLTFLFIGFLKQDRKKQTLLHRKYNTATLIACHTPE